MMKIGSLVFLLVLALSNGAPVEDGKGDQSGQQCPDGSPNGAQIDRGRFIFQCQNGNIIPKGCYTDDLTQVEVGGTFDRKQYRLRCVKQGEQLALELVGCVLEGQEHKADDVFEHGANFYTCKRKGDDALELINLGCLADGKRVNLNDRVAKGDLVLLCNKTVNNGAKLVPDGCVKDGKQYNVGDSFEAGRIWYKCARFGRETVVVKPAGCVSNGKRLNDGDRFVENGIAYECMIDSATKDIRVTACVVNGVERKVGCYFNEGEGPFQYEMRCLEDKATKTAKKVFIRCNYKSNGGTYGIEPGCYRLIQQAAFGCLKDGDKLQLKSFEGEKAEESAQSAGLHKC
jgi:hypothetical protein